MDLHRITLGALIIALGLLVDDAIIAIEMMVVKMEQGWDRARAATFAWTSTAFPMLTGTLVTAAGFLPVGFAKSSSGEYAGGIFWVVGLALIASWLVAVVFTPYLGLKLLPDLTKHGARENPDVDLRHAGVSRAAPRHRILPALAQVGRSRHGADVRRLDCGLPLRAAAVLPDLDARRAFPRDAPAGRDRDRRHRRDGEERREADRGRRRCRDLHDLCGSGLTALLDRPQPDIAELELRADRHRDEGPGSTRARQGETGKGARQRRARRRRAPAWTASCSDRRSDSRCSSVWSGPTR